MKVNSTMRRLLNRIESLHLEHKAAGATLAEITQTVCAFLNSGGGTLLVEAGTNRQEAQAREREIEQKVRASIKPAAFWTTGIELAENGYYCIVDVPAGRDQPYTAGGSIWSRAGKRTVAADSDAVRSLVEASYRQVERWERQTLPGAGPERLDGRLIRATAEAGRVKRDFPFSDLRRQEAILHDLALFRHGAITNAAEVLFGVRPSIQFPQVRAQVAIFAAHKSSDLVDSRNFAGPVFQMLEDMLAMVKKHTPVTGQFRGGLRRIDQPAYPEEAVREGLVNAFAHRDYADYSGGISVHLFPERLVIWNAGQLPAGLKAGDLKREHPSMPRNPDISQVLWLRGYMERVGRGTQSIVDWCREAGLPDPVWETGTGVTLTFRFAAKATSAQLNARQKKFLADHLRPGASIRLADYREKYLVSERQGRRDLTDLVEKGFISRQGEGPQTVFVRLDKPGVPSHPRP